ncbi:MAG TPA: diacylglycerol kinase family protein [Egibacteraceae bacterium]|nr:diacylglycerol kinase family protein [Egibacteraceae bacterium]
MTADFAILANPQAGGAEAAQLDDAAAVLSSAAAVTIHHADSPEALDDVLDQTQGATLVVAGGDGSLHAVVASLRSRGRESLAERALGLIPLGTGNDFARGVGVPLDPVEAALIARDGQPRALDLIVDDADGVVVNAVHAGLGAAAAETGERYKPALGALAYPLGALIAGVRESGYRMRIEIDGQVVHDGPALMAGVMNGPSIGGGAMLCAHAQVDDGLLDVVIARGVGASERIAFGAALREGTHLQRDDVAHLRGVEATIAGDPMRHDADGEISEEIARRTYRVEAAAWQLIAAPSEARRQGG